MAKRKRIDEHSDFWKGKLYDAKDFGEEDLVTDFRLKRDDAKDYFVQYIKPRADLSHKLFASYTGDRAREIESWRSNLFVPYVYGTTMTLLPRILDARPDFEVRGRSQDDQDKAEAVQNLNDFTWEKARMDDVSEVAVMASMEVGMTWLKPHWKKDVRKGRFLSQGQDPVSRKPRYEEKEVVLYDAPVADNVDIYSLWYDWRNIPHESKQFFCERKVLNGADVRRQYPGADQERLNMAFRSGNSDLTEYGHVRFDVKSFHSRAVRNGNRAGTGMGTGFPDWGLWSRNTVSSLGRYQNQYDPELRFHEVFEMWEPFRDSFSLWVNEVPVFSGGERPIPFDHKEAPYIDLAYFRYPFEYEGVGIPLLLEHAQMGLNTVKNQRMDNALMAMHKMFVLNPLSGIKQEQLAVRPFGLVYSQDPAGLKPIEFSDIKESAYREEDLLKADMRFASGVDDFSMGVGGNASSATEVRHLRESTLERVRLFVNHLGSAYARVMRHWISMYSQFMTEDMVIRIVGEDGAPEFPVISREDVTGDFDFVATVLPSIAGQDEVEKKQNMDLFQVLSQMPFIDLQKLTAKVLVPWKWTLSSVSKPQEPAVPGLPDPSQQQVGPDGQPIPGAPQPQAQDSSSLDALMGGEGPQAGNPLPPETMKNALAAMMGGKPPMGGQQPFSPPGGLPPSPFAQAAMPMNLAGGMPPTAAGIGGASNRKVGGGVNTGIGSKSGQGNRETGSKIAAKANDVRSPSKKK